MRPEQQTALTQLADDERFEVVILDNLSMLVTGLSENAADDWEMVLPWLLGLRRRNVATAIVAHAGKNGDLRGTSRREDNVNWVMRLKEAQFDGTARGARFISEFTKNRTSTDDQCIPLLWQFQNGERVTYDCTPQDPLVAFLALVAEGWTGNP